jgi:hypothetical protein
VLENFLGFKINLSMFFGGGVEKKVLLNVIKVRPEPIDGI